MGRIGSALSRIALGTALLVSSVAAGAEEVEFFQTAEPTEIGTEDTLRLSIVASNAPDTAKVQFPETNDFEVLSRSQSTEIGYHLQSGGPGVIKRVTKWVLVLRPKKAGQLTIPSSLLVTENRNYRADAIKVTVKKGHVSQAPPPPTPRDPFSSLFGRDPLQERDERDNEPRVQIPRNDSDLFVRSFVDKEQAYVGEQITLSVYVFSRVDLSSVDSLNMPKLEGFWSEEIDSPSQLAGDQRVINGVPYRSYLLRKRALFPVKAGTVQIEPADADITTGFLFSNRRVHRKGNPLTITVKPLPAGKPPDFSSSNVGQWRLLTEVTETQIALGQPTTVRVILEGRGNLRNVTMPALVVPPGLRAFDPTTTDKMHAGRAQLGGRRVQEYLVMPQQTGRFTIAGLAFPYFDPAQGRYETSRTDPITITVEPGSGGAVGATPTPPEETAKNVLLAGGLKPLRHQAAFESEATPLWRKPFFIPALLAPPFLFLALVFGGALRERLGREDAESNRKRRARAARARLSAAEKLKTTGKADAFYGEVEKAVLTFLEAKLDGPVVGLTREALDARMTQKGVDPNRRVQVLHVLEACDTGRYSPAGGEAVRAQILDDAEAAMEGWK